MPDSFTVYWSKSRVDIARGWLASHPIPFLCGGPHISQPSFSRAGVKPGDTVYPITLRGPNIHLLASFTVDRIIPVDEFIEHRPDLYPLSDRGRWIGETLDLAAKRLSWHRALCWTCTEHVLVPVASSAVSLRCIIPTDCLSRLTFRSQKAERLLRWSKDGKTPLLGSIDRIYRLADESAEDLRLAHIAPIDEPSESLVPQIPFTFFDTVHDPSK
jgi:hypothetical protein